MYYVGIDWADQKHDIALLDNNGTVIVKPFTIKKSPEGFAQLVDKLRRLSPDPVDFKIGIETPFNLLVDFLVDLGYAVFALFPGAMKSFRKRYRASSARDDRFDALVVADVLRTDKACWRRIDFGSEPVREIRLVVRDHHFLVSAHIAFCNSLRSTLKEYYPEYVQFFSNVACASSLAFLVAYPDFAAAQKLAREQLADFFKEHHFRRSKTVNTIYELLHRPHLRVPEALVRVKKRKALVCAKNLVALQAELDQYTARLKEIVEQHPDGQLFLSYPGVSSATAARLLALFGDNRQLYLDVDELRALAGTCPVTEKSGGFSVTYYRRACNKFYRDAIHHLAFSSLRQASWAMAYYRKHRAMGKTHSHALRCLANIHLRLLFAMWKSKTAYDENLFLAQKTRHQIVNQQI